MEIIILPRAEKQFRRLSKVDQIVLATKIRSLKNKKISTGKEKLKGFKDVFRIRVSHYRIVYKQSPGKIWIILISHRKDVYKILQRVLG
ncbi:type II toxin-antitoxin system RelE/ParE family toxin [Patescibacteria group bacterium]